MRVSADLEREGNREFDAVRFQGVPLDCLYEGFVVVGVNLVAAVAAKSLVGKHVTANTWSQRLETG
jgi:hypothetical protein